MLVWLSAKIVGRPCVDSNILGSSPFWAKCSSKRTFHFSTFVHEW